MKKINFIAVAFTAILSQSVNANSTIWSHIIGAKAGTENKIVIWQNTDHDNGVSFKNGNTGEDKNTAVLPGDERKILRNCPPAERGLGFRNTYGVAMLQNIPIISKSIFTKNDKGIRRGAETAYWSNDAKKTYRDLPHIRKTSDANSIVCLHDGLIFRNINFIKTDDSNRRRAETAFWSNDAKKKYRNILPEENGRREQIYTGCSVGC